MRLADQKSKILLLFLVVLISSTGIFAQDKNAPKTQEMSDEEGIPVLIKHLPDWESKQASAKFFSENESFRAFFSGRPVTQKVDFFPGTEAVFAKYNEGQLLIVEYTTPQASVAVDKILIESAGGGDYIYRRIGNYNVFLFDPADPEAGAALLDKIKYQKVVTWPYGDPRPFFQKERDFILGTTSLFISTVLFIVTILGLALLFGAILGILFFRSENRRRSSMAAFSDAGGLTRLNLDGLSAEMPSDNLLED